MHSGCTVNFSKGGVLKKWELIGNKDHNLEISSSNISTLSKAFSEFVEYLDDQNIKRPWTFKKI